MEVSVLSAEGLPEGCILSIRAGNTRRQAPLPLTEPFRFPSLPFNAKHFKVDVLSTHGGGRLDINVGKEEETYTVPVKTVDGQQVSVGLLVRENPTLCGKRAAELKQMDRGLRSGDETGGGGTSPNTPATPGEKANQVVRDTREYAREHNLNGMVQEMLQYVLRERPDAPYSFMSAFLRSRGESRGEKMQAGEAKLEASAVPQGNGVIEPDRRRLEAEHIALRAERALLLRELAELEAAALASTASS